MKKRQFIRTLATSAAGAMLIPYASLATPTHPKPLPLEKTILNDPEIRRTIDLIKIEFQSVMECFAFEVADKQTVEKFKTEANKVLDKYIQDGSIYAYELKGVDASNYGLFGQLYVQPRKDDWMIVLDFNLAPQ